MEITALLNGVSILGRGGKVVNGWKSRRIEYRLG